jgi:hypothetical protein
MGVGSGYVQFVVTSQIGASSRKAYLSGHRKPSSISFEMRASSAIIGAAISGHPGALPAARLALALWGASGENTKFLL